MDRRTATALLGAAGGLLLVVTALLLLDVYVPATLPSVPETVVVQEVTLVPLIALGGVLVGWAVARTRGVPAVVALPLGGGVAALVVRLGLGLATASLTAGATTLVLAALQTLAIGLGIGAVATVGVAYPERWQTGGAAVLAIGAAIIASTAFGATLDRVLFAVLAPLVAGGAVAVGTQLWRRPSTIGAATPTAASTGTGGADPTDPFADADEGSAGSTAGGTGAAGGTATAGGAERGVAEPDPATATDEPSAEQPSPDEDDGDEVADLSDVVPEEELDEESASDDAAATGTDDEERSDGEETSDGAAGAPEDDEEDETS